MIEFEKQDGENIPTIIINIVDEGTKIGHVLLVPHSHYLYEIHITEIHPDYRGYALQISKVMLTYIFRNYTMVEKIIAMIPIDNRLAIALARRSGMKKEGKLKGSIRINGILKDQEILGISRGK